MSDIDTQVLDILKEFGGESSMFLITNPDSPWGKLGDADSLKAAVESLVAQGTVEYDAGSDVVKVK